MADIVDIKSKQKVNTPRLVEATPEPLPPLVTVAEMYAVEEKPVDEIVWTICDHGRPDEKRCHRCPASEPDPNYGPMTRMCYLLAVECWRYAKAAERKYGK